jgi:hypothetical protein
LCSGAEGADGAGGAGVALLLLLLLLLPVVTRGDTRWHVVTRGDTWWHRHDPNGTRDQLLGEFEFITGMQSEMTWMGTARRECSLVMKGMFDDLSIGMMFRRGKEHVDPCVPSRLKHGGWLQPLLRDYNVTVVFSVLNRIGRVCPTARWPTPCIEQN